MFMWAVRSNPWDYRTMRLSVRLNHGLYRRADCFPGVRREMDKFPTTIDNCPVICKEDRIDQHRRIHHFKDRAVPNWTHGHERRDLRNVAVDQCIPTASISPAVLREQRCS